MILGNYTLVNGSFILSEEFTYKATETKNLMISEKIRVIRSKMPFFNETLELLKIKLSLFDKSFSEFTENEGKEMKRQIERTLNKNKHFLGAIVTVSLSFPEGKSSYLIQSERCTETDYEMNEKGLFVSVFDKIQKPVSPISSLSLGSELYWEIAKANNKENPNDRFLIQNTQNQIIEIPESNIYIVTNNFVTGINTSRGAYLDVTRLLMLEIFRKLKLKYSEVDGIETSDILNAEEFFFVNSIEGIRWIIGFEGKRFYNNTVRKISEAFNQVLI